MRFFTSITIVILVFITAYSCKDEVEPTYKSHNWYANINFNDKQYLYWEDGTNGSDNTDTPVRGSLGHTTDINGNIIELRLSGSVSRNDRDEHFQYDLKVLDKDMLSLPNLSKEDKIDLIINYFSGKVFMNDQENDDVLRFHFTSDDGKFGVGNVYKCDYMLKVNHLSVVQDPYYGEVFKANVEFVNNCKHLIAPIENNLNGEIQHMFFIPFE